MKVEQLVVQYLYNNKKVSLQNIGSFTVSPQVTLSSENDKDVVLPAGAIDFLYDPHAEQEDGLVDFIVQQTRKIKPLATSDLESYGILARQFLNIGKPFHIPGLGTLQKNQLGTYDFIQGTQMNAKLGSLAPLKQDKEDEEPIFKTPERESKGKGGVLLIVVLMIVVIAGAMYYFLTRNDSEQPVTNNIDTLKVEKNLALDTIATPRDSISISQKPDSIIPRPTDGFSFKVVIKEYSSKLAADNAFKRLSSYGHKLVLIPVDSTHYRIAIPFTSPLSDTLRAKDSLSKFFQSKAYIQL